MALAGERRRRASRARRENRPDRHKKTAFKYFAFFGEFRNHSGVSKVIGTRKSRSVKYLKANASLNY